MSKEIKPDGYIIPLSLKGLKWGLRIEVCPVPETCSTEPVCLVPPELLEWVEVFRELVSRRPPRERNSDEAHLLYRLNRIWPEKV